MTIQAGYNDNAKCKDGQFNEQLIEDCQVGAKIGQNFREFNFSLLPRVCNINKTHSIPKNTLRYAVNIFSFFWSFPYFFNILFYRRSHFRIQSGHPLVKFTSKVQQGRNSPTSCREDGVQTPRQPIRTKLLHRKSVEENIWQIA